MVNSVTLSPVNAGNHSTLFDAKYFDKQTGQTITLLTNYGVAIDRVPTANEQKLIQWFKPNMPVFTITWDDKLETSAKIAEFVKYLKRHSDVKCEGNYNAVLNPQFKLVDSRQVHIERADGIKAKLAVGNLIKGMRVSEMMEVAYLVGSNPAGKTTENIFVDLCDFNLGKCMTNAPKFLLDWKAPDTSHIVYARKAIALEIIKMDNGIYKLNNSTIGSGIDDVVAYFKNNPEQFENYIKKEVNEKDTLPVAINEDVTVDSVLNKKHTVDTSTPNGKKSTTEKENNKAERAANETASEDKRKALIAECIQLGVKGAQMADKGGWSIDALERKVKEAKGKVLQPA